MTATPDQWEDPDAPDVMARAEEQARHGLEALNGHAPARRELDRVELEYPEWRCLHDRYIDHGEPCSDCDDPSPTRLPDSFWESRPVLAHIATAARSRLVAPDATLFCTLARLAVLAGPRLRVPAMVGSASPLSLAVFNVSESGGGKGGPPKIAEELLPVDLLPPDERAKIDLHVQLGSGEGVAEAFMGSVETDDGKTVRRQTKHGVLISVDEGQVLAKLASRSGSTTAEVLRTTVSGNTFGQSNATADRTRLVRNYVASWLVAIQFEHCDWILGDEAGGTPQRFLFASTTDPSMPHPAELPDWPGSLGWPPMAGEVLGFPDVVQHEVRMVRWLRTRGEVVLDPLDGHRTLLRLRVAGLLALLDGRHEVAVDDWELARQVVAVSVAVRSSVIEYLRRIRAAEAEGKRRQSKSEAKSAREGEHEADDEREARAMTSAIGSVLRRLDKLQQEQGGPVAGRDLQSAVDSKHRRAVGGGPAVIAELAKRGLIERFGDGFVITEAGRRWSR